MSARIARLLLVLSPAVLACGPAAGEHFDQDPGSTILLESAPWQPDIQAGDPCEALAASMACEEEGLDGALVVGARFCDVMSDELQWGPCIAADEMSCVPGEGDGCSDCELFGGVPTMVDNGMCGSTPLVLRFDEAPITYSAVSMAGPGFDIDGVGACDAFDWPTAVTPWLALDRNGDGVIHDGTELFGSGTVLVDGRRADNGFTALAELDDDGDGRIDANDARFGELLAWADHDEDRFGRGLELQAAADTGLVSIELAYHVDPLCDARGNCGLERATFTWRDAQGAMRTGEVVDVHLPCR